VRLLKDLDQSIRGRDVIIVEDIVDTGLTLTYCRRSCARARRRRLRTVCLLSKPSPPPRRRVRRLRRVHIDDHFVVGYGLDYDEQYRNLPYIAVLGEGRS